MGDTPDLPPSHPPGTLRLLLGAALILFPVVLGLAVPLYQRSGPELGGIPFFYWFQMAAAALTAVCTSLVYRMLYRGERDGKGDR
ncbi:DUF3311 domain-containing protein [Sciscionella marina]|uniref:DUF3311 domain-containing protein n=1 Tax=Sciscionella marina TaxID=508770 RepID=UPI000367FF64|nr:DUF3311 domain-containing protein [Sciscionella marina]